MLRRSTPEAYRLFHDGSIALAAVEEAGIRVDTAYLDRSIRKVGERIAKFESKLQQDGVFKAWRKRHGDKTNLASRTQLADVLFNQLRIPYPSEARTPTGRYSTNDDILIQLNEPFVNLYMEVEKLRKLSGTFLKGLRKEVWDGFVHPFFHLHTVETQRGCIAKGTLVEVVRDGTKHPKGIRIEDVKAGDFVYCYDNDCKLALRKVKWAGITGRRKLIRLHWIGGGYRRKVRGFIDLTPEHKVRLSNGDYIEACKLIGDFRSVDSKHCPKIRVLSLSRNMDRLYPTHIDTDIYDHRFVYEQLIGKLCKEDVVHHRDGNHLNNNPINLEKMSKSQHAKHHQPNNLTYEAQCKGRDRIREMWKNGELNGNFGESNPHWISLERCVLLKLLAKSKGKPTKIEYSYSTVVEKAKLFGIDWSTIKDRYDGNGEYISRGRILNALKEGRSYAMRLFKIGIYRLNRMLKSRGFASKKGRYGWSRINNHIITRIEEIQKTEDVYDIEVEGLHNFIAGGICVHNSSSDPNLQNQWNRDPLMARILRRCFIPRDGCVFAEVDYGSQEFQIASAIWADPEMVKYASDPDRNVHRDMAMEIFQCEAEEVTKPARDCAKNQFTFPILYGSFYVNIAKGIWGFIDQHKVQVGKATAKEWLAGKGIEGLGQCDPRQRPLLGTFEHHVKRVEDWFMAKFPVFAKAKDARYEDYKRMGGLMLPTGFWLGGLYSRNFVMNAPVQGSAFHCLLWSLIRMHKWIIKNKFRARIVAQIHDCLLIDCPVGELQDVLAAAKRIMTEDIRRAWPWIIVPLKAEVDVCPAGTSWWDKAKWVERDGLWAAA